MVGRGGSGASIGVAATSSIGKGVVEVALVEGKARLKEVVILKGDNMFENRRRKIIKSDLRVCLQDGAGQVPCEAASTTGSVADLSEEFLNFLTLMFCHLYKSHPLLLQEVPGIVAPVHEGHGSRGDDDEQEHLTPDHLGHHPHGSDASPPVPLL